MNDSVAECDENSLEQVVKVSPSDCIATPDVSYILPSLIATNEVITVNNKLATYSVQETEEPQECKINDSVDIFIMADDKSSPSVKAAAIPFYWAMNNNETSANSDTAECNKQLENDTSQLVQMHTDPIPTDSSANLSEGNASTSSPKHVMKQSSPLSRLKRPEPVSRKPLVSPRLSQQLSERSHSVDEVSLHRWSTNTSELPEMSAIKRSPKLNIATKHYNEMQANQETSCQPHLPPDYNSSVVAQNCVQNKTFDGVTNGIVVGSLNTNLDSLDATVPLEDSHVTVSHSVVNRPLSITPVYTNARLPPPISKKPLMSQISLSQRSSLGQYYVNNMPTVRNSNSNSPASNGTVFGLYGVNNSLSVEETSPVNSDNNAYEEITTSATDNNKKPADKLVPVNIVDNDKKPAVKVAFRDSNEQSQERANIIKLLETTNKMHAARTSEEQAGERKSVITAAKQLRFLPSNNQDTQMTTSPNLIQHQQLKKPIVEIEGNQQLVKTEPPSLAENGLTTELTNHPTSKEVPLVDPKVERMQHLQKKLKIEFDVSVSSVLFCSIKNFSFSFHIILFI